MIYLDILSNECGDNLLYVNGESYQDIDDTWVNCLDNLKDLFGKNVRVQIRQTTLERQYYPDKLEDYKVKEIVWKTIGIDKIQYYIGKYPVKWSNGDSLFIIDVNDKLPDWLSFEAIISGEWSFGI